MNAGHINRLVYLAQSPIISPYLDRLWSLEADHLCQRRNYYRFLYHLVRETRPAACLEIGVEHGLASAHMAVAAAEYGGIVIGVDHNDYPIPGEIMPEELRNFYYIIGDSTSPNTLATVTALLEGRTLGVVFQDSSHHYAPSVTEWELYTPLCAKGSFWVCDDITESFYEPGVDEKSMKAYFDERPGRMKLRFPDILHRGNTIGVIEL